MKATRLLAVTSVLIMGLAPLSAQLPLYPQTESYDSRTVSKISIEVETLRPAEQFDQSAILSKMRTKEGDPFSQLSFDQDLKMLSKEYDRVDPSIEIRHGELKICIKLWQKPVINAIKWHGNDRIKTGKLQRELGVKPGTVFNREAFNKGFNKIKELYVKKGFFEAELQYTVLPDPDTNEVQINVVIAEGRTGRVSNIQFNGLSKKEQSDLYRMIVTKKYNLFSSWLTGRGIYQEEILEHDKLMIVDYLQNEGFADARVSIDIEESPKTGRVVIVVNADKGQLFEFGSISFSGNQLFTDEEVEKVLLLESGDTYGPEKVRDAMQRIKELYGRKGYIEANVQYELQLQPSSPVYNIHFSIEEGEQYRVGLVRVLGNVSTNTNVILREALLYPGEIFDSRRLEATKQRLEAIGFFKCVNVYTVRSNDDTSLGPNYRDVNIEVEETTTGSVSLFAGASTADSVFGGLDLTENNFNYKGLGRIWKDGLSAVRGNGEYAHSRISFGKRQSSYIFSWLNPYFNDSLWQVGFDLNYSHSSLQSKDYDIDTLGFAVYGNYPLSAFWSFGTKYRFRNSDIDISGSAGQDAKEQQDNSGIVTGLGFSLNFNSIDNPYKPHRGIRSTTEAEILFEHRNADVDKNFPFFKGAYTFTYYYPVWRLGTLKARTEYRAIYPMGVGDQSKIPLSELFFLGGDTTVRGYKPYIIGPHFIKDGDETNDPTGGISSTLFSLEYNQQIIRMIDVFTFWDAGAVSQSTFDIGNIVMSYGFGLRLDIGNRVPLMIGMGFPINPERNDDVKRFFFSMGGQF